MANIAAPTAVASAIATEEVIPLFGGDGGLFRAFMYVS